MATVLNLSATATVTGPTIPINVVTKLFSDTIPLPPDVVTSLYLYGRVFGTPSFEVDATLAQSHQEIKLKSRIGPFNPVFDIHYALPAVVQKWITDVEGAGYSLELVFDATVS